MLWHSSGGVQGEVCEVSIGNHRTSYVSKRRWDDYDLKVLWIPVWQCWKKQFWRLIEKSGTLFFRVFKSRYFRNASPLESARSLINKGLIKRVGI